MLLETRHLHWGNLLSLWLLSLRSRSSPLCIGSTHMPISHKLFALSVQTETGKEKKKANVWLSLEPCCILHTAHFCTLHTAHLCTNQHSCSVPCSPQHLVGPYGPAS